MKKYVWRAAGFIVLLVMAAGLVFYLNPLWVLDQRLYVQLWRSHVVGHYVQAGTNRFHYYEAKPPAGSPETPLVLIHGLGSRGEDWAYLIPTFAANGFHVYAPDLLGCGRSSQPDGDYSIGFEEAAVVQYMQAMHLRKANVIGWSMGGWIAMKLALDQPAMVDRLAVYDTAGTYFPAVLPPGLFAPDDVAGVQRLVDILEPAPRPVPAFIARASLRKLQQNGRIVNLSVASMTGGHYLLDFRLHDLKQPMLIMWGGSDHLIPPSVGEALHQSVKQSVFEVVQGCGHIAPGECPAPFLAETIAFLKAQPPLPPGEKTLPHPAK